MLTLTQGGALIPTIRGSGAGATQGGYVPSTHALHVPPFGPLKPVSQRQAVTSILALGEEEFDGHLVHSKLPVIAA